MILIYGGGNLYGLPILPPSSIENKGRIFISMRYCWQEAWEQLINMGIEENRIINVGKMIADLSAKQYFDLSQLTHDRDEVFVDVGMYNGFTAKAFFLWSKGRYKHIYCFEADPNNFEKYRGNLAEIEKKGNLTIIPKGCWNRTGEVKFISSKYGSQSHVGDEGDCIQVTTIDEELQDERITFIKMDIEGAEYQALQGAEQTIKNQRPKLAISVYHLYDDICKIPALLMQYNPKYEFYLRHYSLFPYETVLYAV